MTFIRASDLLFSGGMDIADSVGRIVVAGGQSGIALFGPYMAAAGGVYRVRAFASTRSASDARGYFDVFDAKLDCRTYAASYFTKDFEVFVHIMETDALEFRFHAMGHDLSIEGVEFTPLLLDTELATPGAIEAMIAQVPAAAPNQSALARLIDRLAEVGGVAAAEVHWTAIARQRMAGEEIRVATVLSAFSAGPPPPHFADDPPLSRDALFAAIPRRAITTFEGVQLTPDMVDALAVRGYSTVFINATRLHRDYDEPPRPWHERPLETGRVRDFPPRQPLFERVVEIDRSYQASLARGEGIAAYCPVSGRSLRSRHGFIQHFCDLPFTFYRFEGAEPFYLCTGHISNLKLFLYMPRTETIVWICDPWYRNYGAVDIVRLFLINLVDFRHEAATYLREPTRPAAVIGSNIYGHWFWTSLSGLDYALRNGLDRDLVEIVRVPRQFMDHAAILPELARLPSPMIEEQSAIFLHGVSRRLLPIHFTDSVMSEALVERLRALARARAAPDAGPPADDPRPLIWINLRAHNKIWVGQVEGYANILNRLHEEYGAAAGFIDGMSNCTEIAAEIRARTRPEIPLYDGLNLSFYDTLTWALKVDSYVSVISSGLLIVNVLAAKDGVAHAEHGHLSQMDWWHTISPGATPPAHPTHDQVTEIGGGLYSDYDVDWRVIYDFLVGVLGPPPFVTARSR